MSTAAMFISAFATTTLLIGSSSGLNAHLTFAGILTIILCTVMTPTQFPGPYSNFDTQQPFRNYMLVFGLASLGFIALFSRSHPLLWPLAREQPVPEVHDTEADHHPCLICCNSSPLHTFASQWTLTASSLTVGSPTSVTSRAGLREVTNPYEMIALELRISQLEIAMEELRYYIDDLTMGEERTLVD